MPVRDYPSEAVAVRRFIWRLSVWASSGVPISQAFERETELEQNPTLRAAISDIHSHILAGGTLSEGLATHSELFPLVFRQAVAVGEETGTLTEALQWANREIERDLTTRV